MLLLFGCGNDNNDDNKSNPGQNKTSSTSEAALSKGAIDENQQDTASEEMADENQNNTNLEKKVDENRQNGNYEKETDANQKKTEKNKPKSKHEITFQKEINGYRLGISVKKLKSKLKKDGYKIILPPDYGEEVYAPGGMENPVMDGRIYQYDSSYIFHTKDLSFYYTAKNKNYAIVAETSKNETKQGIKVGDTKSKMIDVYGKKYRQDYHFYEYKKNNRYLSFTLEDGKIARWYISNLPIDFNAP